ncbi:thiamine ABC transporter substrate-binding protein [Jonesia quinghaiensis]|uniref:thiamine ABC transporter substrate-binding protein n=1 Tax=Jonesia quinghaiensis TaxID=262806 RepID=UPI00041C7392|nr:thiamine ABC transporter substrate-binding protein [Jonesia quinghaiensis]
MTTSRLRSITATTTLLVLAGTLTACVPSSDSTPSGTQSPAAGGDTEGTNSTVTVVVHDSFQISDEQKAAFTQSTGYDLNVVTNGDGGALVNKLVLTKESPLGDVAYGVDNTFASRGITEGVFAPYTSPAQSPTGADLAIPGDDTLTAVDYGDVCLNLDPTWFKDNNIDEPTSLDDLTDPVYKDLTVVTNPATSSPGLSFMFATIGQYGEEGYLDYWNDLNDNGLKIVDGWEDAYYVDFTGAGDGDRPIALSYASSPAFTVTDDGTETTTTAMLDTCFRQVEYAGVLAGANNPEGGQAFIDFLLGDDFQNTIPDAMYMYPVTDSATLPDAWSQFAPVPPNPISLDPALIATNRDAWIKDWNAQIIG